jgi:hypothetical protein
MAHRRRGFEPVRRYGVSDSALPVSSLAILMDNANTAVRAAREAGLVVEQLYVNPVDFEAVRDAKRRERHNRLPLAIFGIPIGEAADVALGTVRI